MNLKNNKILKQDTENVIKKSNAFSVASMGHGLTLNQLQLFAYAIYATQKAGETKFRKADFERKFELECYQTAQAKTDSKKLLALQVAYVDGEDDWEYWNVFISMKYRDGLFTFEWSPKVLPHILDLRERYITTDLTIASQFKSSFSWRLYDILKASYGLWYKEFTKQQLMQLFNVQNVKTYDNTAQFKRGVLDKAIAEINTLTEYQVHYNEQKEGRAIVGFTLIWTLGETTKKCTQKQLDVAKRVCDMILDQAIEWIDLQGQDARERAKTIVRRTQEISLELAPNLTATHLAGLQGTLQAFLSELERLKENQEPENPVFYNWLDERE